MFTPIWHYYCTYVQYYANRHFNSQQNRRRWKSVPYFQDAIIDHRKALEGRDYPLSSTSFLSLQWTHF